MMPFSEDTIIQNYADSAKQILTENENRLSQIENNFHNRMNGKTVGGIVAAMIGTVCWFVVACIVLGHVKNYVDSRICWGCFGVFSILIFSLCIDEAIGFFYYKKINSYKKRIEELKRNIGTEKNSIQDKRDSFMEFRAEGWDYQFKIRNSVPEEAVSIEHAIGSMESLKSGFINGLKNVFFYTFAVAYTVAGGWALFEITGGIVDKIAKEYSLGDTIIFAFCCVCLVIAIIMEILLAKKVWGKTKCSVTNVTLLIAAAGPLLFMAVAIVLSFVLTPPIVYVALAIFVIFVILTSLL